jgi:hypothetical protein
VDPALTSLTSADATVADLARLVRESAIGWLPGNRVLLPSERPGPVRTISALLYGSSPRQRRGT